MNKLVEQHQQNLPTTTDDRGDPFAAHAQANRATNIVGRLLKYSKGDYSVGDTPIPYGHRFIAHMDSILNGWIRWEDNKPQAHVMGRVKDFYQVPARSTLGFDDEDLWEVDDRNEPRDPWQRSYYIVLKSAPGYDIPVEFSNNPEGEDEIRGHDDGTLFTFPASSTGSIGAVNRLIERYAELKAQHPDDWPIIAIGSSSYAHKIKSYGRVKFPVFTVVGWAPKGVFEGDAELASEPPKQVETEEAKPTARKQAAATRQAARQATPAPSPEQQRPPTASVPPRSGRF
jgi:hypothetical protein